MQEIYKRYSIIVYRYLYSLTKNRALSEELMQETFYDAIKGINKFKGECKISVWLCQIAKNKWKDYLSKSKKLNIVPINNDIETLLFEDTISESLEKREELIQLYTEIHKLDENTREVFYLRLNCEFSFREIGKILGKSEEWARITFYRGKIKLKEEFLKYEK